MDSQAPNIPEVKKGKTDNSNSLPVISMAIFVLVSLGIVIFFYYQNQTLKSELVKYQTATVSPTPVATVVEKTASPSATPKSLKATTKVSPTPVKTSESTSSGIPIVY